MKRAIIIHGWDGSPNEAWFPWLANELEDRGFEVQVPGMPDPERPNIEAWTTKLTEVVGRLDEETILVGHSIGVQTILRYLEQADGTAGGVLAVAGWFTLIPEEIGGPEEEAIAEPWLKTPINTDTVKAKTGGMIAIFSNDDPVVGAENMEMFEERLGARIVIVRDRGHLGGDGNAKEVPEILQSVEQLTNAS